MTPDINQLRTMVANMRERAIQGSRRVPKGNDFESGYETGQISACNQFLQMLDDKHEKPDVDQAEPAAVWPDSPVDYERDVR